MKLGEWVVVAAIVMMMVATVSWQATRIDKLKADNAGLNGQLSAQQVINATTLTAVTTFHRISGETIDAKRKNTLDAQTAKKDVKVILVGNDCASAAAPGGLIDRMRQYKD